MSENPYEIKRITIKHEWMMTSAPLAGSKSTKPVDDVPVRMTAWIRLLVFIRSWLSWFGQHFRRAIPRINTFVSESKK